LNFKLGATLKMEQKVLDILDESIENAEDDRVRHLLTEHRTESERHVRNIEAAFALLGWEAEDSPSPAIEGLEKEAKATAKKADGAVVDTVILEGALEIEHHEIGVYENLIIQLTALGKDDVVRVLDENFKSEQGALEKVRSLQAELSGATAVAAS